MGDALRSTKSGSGKSPAQSAGFGRVGPKAAQYYRRLQKKQYSPGTRQEGPAFSASEPVEVLYVDLLFRHRYRGRYRS